MKPNNNNISISNNNRLMDIQGAFTALYPYLKIDFFGMNTYSKSLKSTGINPHTSLRQLANLKMPYQVDISCNRTVSELSHDFESTLGVMVQVSRKSGNVWNVITLTESCTLKSQNKAGEFISIEMACSSS